MIKSVNLVKLWEGNFFRSQPPDAYVSFCADAVWHLTGNDRSEKQCAAKVSISTKQFPGAYKVTQNPGEYLLATCKKKSWTLMPRQLEWIDSQLCDGASRGTFWIRFQLIK